MTAAQLSRVLNGKRPPTERTVTLVADKLGLSEAERAAFLHRVEAIPTTTDWSALPPSAFEILQHWYALAILELTAVEGFRPDPVWIARVFGLTRKEVEYTIVELRRLGLLEVTKDGRWIDRFENLSTTAYRPTSSAQKIYQQRMLELSARAIDDFELAERDHTALVVATDSARLEAARELIREFRRKMNALLSQEGKRDRVFALHVGLFPVSHEFSRKEVP